MNSHHWIAWEGGVNLIAKTDDKLELPNIILHAARLVHTPFGSAPAGMILWQPDPASPPFKFGFVSCDPKVSAYLADEIFAGTPFQGTTRYSGKISTEISQDGATSRFEVPGYIIETTLAGFSKPEFVERKPLPASPFHQQLIETVASKATLRVNDADIEIIISGSGITGGPSAYLAPVGLYLR